MAPRSADRDGASLQVHPAFLGSSGQRAAVQASVLELRLDVRDAGGEERRRRIRAWGRYGKMLESRPTISVTRGGLGLVPYLGGVCRQAAITSTPAPTANERALVL